MASGVDAASISGLQDALELFGDGCGTIKMFDVVSADRLGSYRETLLEDSLGGLCSDDALLCAYGDSLLLSDVLLSEPLLSEPLLGLGGRGAAGGGKAVAESSANDNSQRPSLCTLGGGAGSGDSSESVARAPATYPGGAATPLLPRAGTALAVARVPSSARSSDSLQSAQHCDAGSGADSAVAPWPWHPTVPAATSALHGVHSSSSIDCYSVAGSPRSSTPAEAATAAPEDIAAAAPPPPQQQQAAPAPVGGPDRRVSSRVRRAASAYAPYHMDSPRGGGSGGRAGAVCRLAPNPHGSACTSCGATSTPVWRAGPAGPKTLCNACGVRFMKHRDRK